MISQLVGPVIVLIGFTAMFVAFVISQSRKLNPFDPRWCKHEGDQADFFDGVGDTLVCLDCGKVVTQ